MFHATLGSGSIHIPFNWIWADSSERTAQTVTADDIYKFGLQEDTQTAYLLLDISPTWTPILTTGGGVNLGDLADVDTSGVTSGQAILYNSGTGYWEVGDVSTNDHTVSDAVTNTLSEAVTLYHNTSGTAADGFGTSILFKADDDTTTDQDIGVIGWSWRDVTTASRQSQLEIIGYNQTDALELGVMVTPSSAFVTPSGNPRGAGAVDLQTIRTAVTDVANGYGSTIVGGGSNSIYGGNYSSIIGGSGNYIAGTNYGFSTGLNNSIGASNASSILGGLNNTITNSVYNTIGGGYSNTIVGSSFYSAILQGSGGYIYNGAEYGVIVGGRSNVLDGGEKSLIVNGYQNSIYGSSFYSSIINGRNNKINQGKISFIGAGTSNFINFTIGLQDYGFIGNGYLNIIKDSTSGFIATGRENYINVASHSTILNGANNLITADYSAILNGNNVKATLTGQIVSNQNSFSSVGDAQNTLNLHLRRSITHSDANWYKLYLDGSSELIVLEANQSTTFDILVHGVNTGGTKILSYHFIGTVKFYGGTVTILSSTKTVIHEDDTDFDCQLTAGTSSLDIEVSDSTSGGDTIHWTAFYRDTQQIFI